MSSLKDLPTELLVEILSHLWEKQDLLNAFLVCKVFHKCAEPFLYLEYVNRESFRAYKPSFKPFMRRIIKRPDLAFHVRRIEIRVWTVRNQMCKYRYIPPPISTEDISLFLNAAQKTGIIEGTRLNHEEDLDPILVSKSDMGGRLALDMNYVGDGYDKSLSFDEKWIQGLRLGLEDPQVILILALLPRLEEIYFREIPPDRLPWEKLIHAKKLQSLKRIRVCGLHGELVWSLAEIEPFLRLPSLQILEGYLVSDTNEFTEEEILWDSPPGCSSLKQVYLECSSMNVRSAKTLIRACRRLESFAFIAGGTRAGPEQFTCSEIKDILMSQAQSLSHLYLDMEGEWDYAFDPGCIGFLSDFSNLKVLEIGQECLINTSEAGLGLCNVLPSSIRTLRLDHADLAIVSHLVQLAAVCKTQFKDLWAVMLVSKGMFNVRPYFAELDAAFNEVDVIIAVCFSKEDARPSLFKEGIIPEGVLVGGGGYQGSSTDTDESDYGDKDDWLRSLNLVLK